MRKMFYLVDEGGLRREGWSFAAQSWYGDGPIIFWVSEYVEEKRETIRHKFRDVNVAKKRSERPFVEPPSVIVDAFREWLMTCPIFVSREEVEKRGTPCPKDGLDHGRHF